VLVSVMRSTEIGVIPGYRGDRQHLREKGVLFHVDAAQATGKMRSTWPSCRSI